MSEKKRFEYRAYIFFILLIGVISYRVIPNIYQDLYRYYVYANQISTSNNIKEFLQNTIDERGDFLYYLFHYLLKCLGLCPNFMTGVSVALYYLIILLFLEKIRTYYKFNFSNPIYSTFITLSLLCISDFWTPILIARNLVAILFLILSLYSLWTNKITVSLFLLLFAFCTHLGIFLYLFVFLTIILAHRLLLYLNLLKKFSALKIIISYFILLILIKYSFNIVISVLNSYFSNILPVKYVESYLNKEYENASLISQLGGLGNSFHFIYIYLFGITGFFFVKKWNTLTFYSFFYYLLFVFFSFTLPFVGQRLSLLLPITFAILSYNILSNSNIKSVRSILFTINLSGNLFIWFLQLYLGRASYL